MDTPTKQIEPTKKVLKRESKYASAYLVIGLMAMTIDLGLYFYLADYLAIAPIPSLIIAVSVAIIFGFVMNQKYNFKVKDALWKRFISYTSINSGGLFAGVIAMYIFNSRLGFDDNIVRITSLIFIVGAQYLLNRIISFNKKSFHQER